jgi:hypothetical protein
MARFFPFSATATDEFKSELANASSSYDTNSSGASLTAPIGTAVTTILGALQLLLQNLLPADDLPISNNTVVAVITLCSAITVCLDRVFNAKEASALSDMNTLVSTGVKLEYFDPNWNPDAGKPGAVTTFFRLKPTDDTPRPTQDEELLQYLVIHSLTKRK